MLKNKNILLLLFVFATTAFLLNSSPSGEASQVKNPQPAREKGKVLGVSEDRVAEPEVKNYLDKEELQEIIPIIDRSNFKPIRKEGSKSPNLNWGSIIAKDLNSGELLYDREADRERSIASITKLVTALVLMDLNIDWESSYTITSEDMISGGRIYVSVGEEIRVKDLLYASLVASANTATRALVSASGLTYDEFVEAMNKKTEELGLEKTHFVDPIGLSSLNVSTAREIALIAEEVVTNGVIRDCIKREKYVFETLGGVSKTINSTNILLDNFPGDDINILGGKTGFTGAAGYCFVGMFEGKNNNKVITVLLGGQSHGSRFADTEKLINWVYGNHVWRR